MEMRHLHNYIWGLAAVVDTRMVVIPILVEMEETQVG
jgi:hypothetical protein